MSHFTTEIEYDPVKYQRSFRRVVVMTLRLAITSLALLIVGVALVLGESVNYATGAALAVLALMAYSFVASAKDAYRQYEEMNEVRIEVLQAHGTLFTYMASYIMPMNPVNAPFVISVAATTITDGLLLTVTHEDPTMNKWTYRLSKTKVETHCEAPPFRVVFADLCGVMEDVGDRRAQRVATLAEQFHPLDISQMDIPVVTPEQLEARALMGD